MFRGKPSQTSLNNPYILNLQKTNSLRSTFSNGSATTKRSNGGVKRNKKKQKRDIEQLVTLGEAYLIVHLCTGEVVLRGLTEVDIFKPVRIGDGANEVRYLINCLLRDNRTEFEDELKFQDIHNVVAGIRWTLRNCTANLVPYEYYEEFVKYEQEWQYDPRKGSFNHFLSLLPRQNKGILIELFDLFAMTMEQSHINRMHPTRILKSMALQIFNESKTKSYENFQSAYQEWLKLSNALIHLFLAYLRERACSTQLPERLHLLLRDYVECRKKCLMNSSVSGNGKDIIISEHRLPDITIADLEQVIRSRVDSDPNNNNNNNNGSESVSRKSSLLRKLSTKTINKSNRSSIADMFPDIFESLNALKRKASFKSSSPNIIIINDPRTAETKWDELQTSGLGIMSEEALKLFFAYDDRDTNSIPISVDRKKSLKKRTVNERKNERPNNALEIPPLPKMEFVEDTLIGGIGNSLFNNNNNSNNNNNNNDSSSSEYPDDKRQSALSSTLGPSSSDSGGGDGGGLNVGSSGFNSSYFNYNDSTTLGNTARDESQEVRSRGRPKRSKMISFLCIKKRRSSSEDSSAYMQGHTYEDWEDWQIIDQAVDLSDYSDYLTVETIDALFPYVWIEANIDEQDEQWGEWIFIEPRRGLIHECEWIMIEERNQFLADWEQNLNNTNNIARNSSRGSKLSALSSINLPWIKSSKSNSSKKSDSSSSLMPPSPVQQQFNRSNNSSFTRPPPFNRSNNSSFKSQQSNLQRKGTPEQTASERDQELNDRLLQQQQQEEEESKRYQIHKYQQDQQKLLIEQQEKRERRERERLQQEEEEEVADQAQYNEGEEEEEADQYYQDDVYDQYRDEEQASEDYDEYDQYRSQQQTRPQVRKQNSSQQFRPPIQKQNSQQQFRSPQQQFNQRLQQNKNYQTTSRDAEEEDYYDQEEDEYYNKSNNPPYPQAGRQSPMQGRLPNSLIPGRQSPYSGLRGKETPYAVNPQRQQGRQSPAGVRGGPTSRQSPIMTNGQLPGRQANARQPPPQSSDQMNQMNPGRSARNLPNNAQLPGGRQQQSPMRMNANLPNGRQNSPATMNAQLPGARQLSPRQMNTQLPGRQSPMQTRQNPIGVRTPPMQNAQIPPKQQYPPIPPVQQFQQYPPQQMGYQQQYPQQPQQQQYSPRSQPQYPQQQYPQQSPQQYPQQPPQQYIQQPQLAINRMPPQQVPPTQQPPIITQTTKTQTSRKIQVPTANNTTTEIEETVVQYENVTVSTTQSSVRVQQQHLQQQQQQYERERDKTRSPTESEIIEGYTVPFALQPTQQEPQYQVSTYNPPGTFGPYPASYTPTPPSPLMNGPYPGQYSTPPSPLMNGPYPGQYSTPPSPLMNGPYPGQYSTPPSPIMNSQGSYMAAQSFPTSIQSNLPPEYFNQQQQQLPNLYNVYSNLPPQIPMTIPLEVPAQQIYLNYPPEKSFPQQQPYFPPGYVPVDGDKGKGKAKVSKKYRIAN